MFGPARSTESFCRKFYSERGPQGSCLVEGRVLLKPSVNSGRLSASRLRSHPLGVRVCERACACARVYVWGGERQGVGSGAARRARGDSGAGEVVRPASVPGTPAARSRPGCTSPCAPRCHRPPGPGPRPPAARPAWPAAGTGDGAGLTPPPPDPCAPPGVRGGPGASQTCMWDGRSRRERAALGAPEAVPGRAGGRGGGGGAARARSPARRGPGARAPRRELRASQARRRDPEAEAEPRVEPRRCPCCPPAPGGGPGGWMGSGGAGRGRRWARSRAR